MNTEEELRQEADKLNERHGKHYKVRNCKRCGIRYVGGTTSTGCNACYFIKQKEDSVKMVKQTRDRILNKTREKNHCMFCKATEKLDVHHIDKDTKNNKAENLALLCRPCHKKLHGRIYNPLLKKVFNVLAQERLTYDEIGVIFSTTRQNVYNILNK